MVVPMAPPLDFVMAGKMAAMRENKWGSWLVGKTDAPTAWWLVKQKVDKTVVEWVE